MQDHSNDAPSVHIKFKEDLGFKLEVKKSRIANILKEVNGGFNNLTLENLIYKLKDNDKNLEINIRDISYEYKKNNETKQLKDRLILFGLS